MHLDQDNDLGSVTWDLRCSPAVCSLLKRDGFAKHPGGLSSLMFAFAALVIWRLCMGITKQPNAKFESMTVMGNCTTTYLPKTGLCYFHPLLVLYWCYSVGITITSPKIEVNESGAYLEPSLLSAAAALKQDEELFQTARLVNCGWFGDSLVREGSSLNPFGEFRKDNHSLFERGEGNHATTSAKDETWVNGLMDDMFDGKAYDEISLADFKVVGKKLSEMDPEVTRWTFGQTDEPAAAFRARGTPQWNFDPNIAFAAEKLYGNIDSLELYVGLQAEEAKPLVDGAGLCPGYTISRAILSDAVALTRGDRFFTRDFTPANLTVWGFADCQRDPNAFGFGSALGKLFLRTLPREFGENGNNIYAFFPLMTPESMKVHLTKMGSENQYDLKRPVKKEATARKAAKVLEAKGKGFYIIENDEQRRQAVLNALIASMESDNEIGQYFYTQTITLMWKVKSVIDIVRDVLKPLVIGFVATEVCGISLTKGSHRGSYTPLELYDILGNIYEGIQTCKLAVENPLIRRGNKEIDFNFAKRLVELRIPGGEVTNTVLAVMVALTNVVNICVSPESRTGDVESRVRNVMRQDPTFCGASIDLEPALDGNIQQEIFGLSQCLGESLTVKILSETVRAVCSYPGICRGPGQSGVLRRFKIEDNIRHQLRYGYLDNDKKVSPWPTSLMMQDGQEKKSRSLSHLDINVVQAAGPEWQLNTKLEGSAFGPVPGSFTTTVAQLSCHWIQTGNS
ncbi:linoleate diol synthase [Desarmillaria ectypa]|nr:linoleate diol synthase [Desarmillaria ectypa]